MAQEKYRQDVCEGEYWRQGLGDDPEYGLAGSKNEMVSNQDPRLSCEVLVKRNGKMRFVCESD